jgi:photosystem II stability/assembly factor-like uncharacterized protein
MKVLSHICLPAVAALVLCSGAPQASDVVYAGAIDAFCQMHFMVSKDAGETWVERTTPGGSMEIHAITPVPATPGALYISQGSSIYLSTQYGYGWSDDLFPYNNVPWVHDVEVDPVHPEWLWATSSAWPLSSSDTLGVFLSTDSGTTWEYGGEGLPYVSGASVSAYCIALGAGSPRIGYVGTWEAIGDTTLGVYTRDLSAGTTRWQYSGLRGEGPIKDIAVDPVDQDLCFALTGLCGSSTGAVWRTTDGGGSWEKVLDGASTLGTIDWDFEYRNGVLYVPVFARGMYVSADQGSSWECYSAGLNPAVSCVSVSPRDASMVHAGCQPSAGPPNTDPFYKSIDGGQTWFQSAHLTDFVWCVLLSCGYPASSVVDGNRAAGERLSISVISPNPCRTGAEVLCCMTQAGLVTLGLYDVGGRRIEEISSRYRRHGEFVQRVETSHLVPGVYFVKVSENGNEHMRKLVVID